VVVLAVLAAAGLVIQTWRVGELSGQVQGLTAELQAAQTALDAYRGQLGEIRSSVEDLQGRMADLDQLVNRDPLAAPAPETP
jgi:outer membrane murein-binding lipoprotein Lpp